MATTSAQVQQLYVAYLGRAADKAGLDYWLGELNAEPAKITLDQIRTNFVNEQPEYANAYAGLNRVDTVTKIYNNLFGRAPDAAGLTYWTTGGGATVAADQLLVAFINGASSADAQVVANKVLVSEVYTSTAGSNYAAADAKAIISGVTDTTASVTTAIGKLSDGSLSGIAIPTAAANLKASVIADKAVTDFETSKAADMLALAKQIETLSKANAQLTDTTVASDATTVYTNAGGTGVADEVKGDLAQARTGLSGKTTAELTSAATLAAAKVESTANDFRTDSTQPNSVAKMAAYDAAVKAAAANKATDPAVATESVNALAAFGANSANAAVWTKALTDAGLTQTTGGNALTDAATDAQALYDFLKAASTTSTQVSTITTDFAGVNAFTAFAANAAADKASAKAATDLATASGDLTGPSATAWKNAYDANVTAKAQVEASTALDALDSAYKAIDTAHAALVQAQTSADGKVAAADAATTTASAISFTDVATKAQVFYFPTTKTFQGATSQDGSVTLAAGKDALYVGEGYTLNKTATLGATGVTGGDNNALEVFFFKDSGGAVKAVIENNVASSMSVTGDALASSTADTVSVITLTGVTDVSQVTFANGVISHV
ncbi:Uncharacterised protein [Pseudomonas putida]|nr:Uncharacterised protein [Pseudomonas putida]